MESFKPLHSGGWSVHGVGCGVSVAESPPEGGWPLSPPWGVCLIFEAGRDRSDPIELIPHGETVAPACPLDARGVTVRVSVRAERNTA